MTDEEKALIEFYRSIFAVFYGTGGKLKPNT